MPLFRTAVRYGLVVRFPVERECLALEADGGFQKQGRSRGSKDTSNRISRRNFTNTWFRSQAIGLLKQVILLHFIVPEIRVSFSRASSPILALSKQTSAPTSVFTLKLVRTF